MANEIKRNYWSRFFRKFNNANQYRQTELSVRIAGKNTAKVEMGPFLGVTLSKKGRVIDGVQFLTGNWNPDSVVEPVVTVREPSNIWLEKDKKGHDNRLRVRAKDGTEASLELRGEKEPKQERMLVEKVAYSMFEHRGCCHGNDLNDWLEAENRVKQYEMELTE
jgi:hypothetical protein